MTKVKVNVNNQKEEIKPVPVMYGDVIKVIHNETLDVEYFLLTQSDTSTLSLFEISQSNTFQDAEIFFNRYMDPLTGVVWPELTTETIRRYLRGVTSHPITVEKIDATITFDLNG